MINQLLAGVHIAAACEAITFAAKQGLDLGKVYEVITASAGNSWMFENRVPHVLAGDYTPLSAVEIFVKDLGIIQDMARIANVPGAGGGGGAADVPDGRGAGMGRDDDASVARIYAQLTGAPAAGAATRIHRQIKEVPMPRFAANLSMMFTEWPFLDRFDAAADAGFVRWNSSFPMSIRAGSDRRAAAAATA